MPPSELPTPAAAGAVPEDLLSLVHSCAPTDGVHDTAIPGLQLIRASAPALPLPALYEPGLVLVVQGRKHARLGERLLVYDAGHYLLASVTMLPVGHVVQASAREPYLCLRLRLDAQDVAALLLQHPELAPAPLPQGSPGLGLGTAATSAELLDATRRLLRLLHAPQHLAVLAPLTRREIVYWVLRGELGPQLASLVALDGPARRVAAAIRLVRDRVSEPLRIDALAAAVHMSPSTLHEHFKRVTSLSPLQYQKHLRLHQARQLMLSQGMDAARAGHLVGYESPSQFSREYRRLFGAPPRSEVQSQRRQPAAEERGQPA